MILNEPESLEENDPFLVNFVYEQMAHQRTVFISKTSFYELMVPHEFIQLSFLLLPSLFQILYNETQLFFVSVTLLKKLNQRLVLLNPFFSLFYSSLQRLVSVVSNFVVLYVSRLFLYVSDNYRGTIFFLVVLINLFQYFLQFTFVFLSFLVVHSIYLLFKLSSFFTYFIFSISFLLSLVLIHSLLIILFLINSLTFIYIIQQELNIFIPQPFCPTFSLFRFDKLNLFPQLYFEFTKIFFIFLQFFLFLLFFRNIFKSRVITFPLQYPFINFSDGIVSGKNYWLRRRFLLLKDYLRFRFLLAYVRLYYFSVRAPKNIEYIVELIHKH